ncbi:DUF1801 domain-containing protein [Chryseobacterium pennae]|uniref:DUF1801 domain-containing protein n=1 Tax=Chryseobacterium pennae TaxID=2258962 RepID=A0A3D9CAC7_9FLAO|nr:DUF1801 domain-containing protein [Chryseobacterium pennae]REC62837.1 DUF1801 domain-containing protein [Chryseobacterium pennae]
MTVQEQISEYINSHPEPQRADLQELHRIILELIPDCKLMFIDDEKNDERPTFSHARIGYGLRFTEDMATIPREYPKIEMDASSYGITIAINELHDKTYLMRTFGEKIGKASITGLFIKFKELKDINIETLEAAIRYSYEQNS